MLIFQCVKAITLNKPKKRIFMKKENKYFEAKKRIFSLRFTIKKISLAFKQAESL